jgi:hypothetical protein
MTWDLSYRFEVCASREVDSDSRISQGQIIVLTKMDDLFHDCGYDENPNP